MKTISSISKQLLNLLYEDSMVSQKELGVKLGYTRQSTSKILNNLEKSGIISKFSIVENPNVQDSRIFFVAIKTNPEEPEIVSQLEEMSSIRSIDGIIGLNSLMVKFFVRDSIEFNDVINQLDRIIAGTRFQHYRIIECIKIFKDAGKILENSGKTQHLDDLDRTILKTLNSFKTKFTYNGIFKELETIEISLNYTRIRKKIKILQDSGVIHSFTIKISPKFVDYTDSRLKFYLEIKPKDFSKYNSIALNTLAPLENIVEIHRTGQEYGLLAVIRTESIAQYRIFIEDLYKSGKIQDSITTLVIDEKLPSTFKPFNLP